MVNRPFFIGISSDLFQNRDDFIIRIYLFFHFFFGWWFWVYQGRFFKSVYFLLFFCFWGFPVSRWWFHGVEIYLSIFWCSFFLFMLIFIFINTGILNQVLINDLKRLFHQFNFFIFINDLFLRHKWLDWYIHLNRWLTRFIIIFFRPSSISTWFWILSHPSKFIYLIYII